MMVLSAHTVNTSCHHAFVYLSIEQWLSHTRCLLKCHVKWYIQKVGKWFSFLLLTINKGVEHGGVGMRIFTPWLGVPNPVLITVCL